MRLSLFFLISLVASIAQAKTHTWWFKTTWVTANPDGCFEKQVIGFNDSWPLPTLRVQKGDTVNLYLINGFDDRNTSLHFHGMFQNGSSQMDGPEMVTQCPIPVGETMLYNFTVADQVGSFWYHSHTSGQYGDGMRGAFIIEEPSKEDYPYEYDEEVVLTLSEHYHENSDYLTPKFLSRYNPTGAEPIPQNILFNETRNNTWNVQPDTTYLLRVINTGRFVSQYLYMEGHEFTVVEVDGIYVEKNTTDMLYITVAQRYTCLVTTKNETDRNYAFMAKIDDDMLDVIPKDLVRNSTNYIIYDKEQPLPEQYMVDSIDDYLDDFFLVPLAKTKLLDDADHVVTVSVKMDNLNNGVNYAFFNDTTYTRPKVPTLVTAMSAGKLATNELVYGVDTHSIILQKDEIVDIVLENLDTGKHPFHLHGHTFQLIERHEAVEEPAPPVAFNASDHAEWPEYPMERDTVYVRPQSYIVMRFKANNPGVWFFHCHLEWHLDQGLALIFIEDPMGIQEDERQAFTPDFINSCKKNGIDMEGNAAGNSKDFLDLSGQNLQQKALPSGFTARGIVALVFSCIAAFLGLAAISFYGMADIKNVEERVARDLDIDLTDDEEADELTESTSFRDN
jgi:iron transport multicopper oxidase